MVYNPRDEINHFVTEVSDDMQEECHSAILHDNMNITCPMVHNRHMDEARAKKKSKDAKRARFFDGGSSKGRLKIQDKRRFKKRVSNHVPLQFSSAKDNKVSNPKPKMGRDTRSTT